MSSRGRVARLISAALSRWARGGPASDGDRVALLLMHAWGLGGTIRVTLEVAGRLARDHDVEILSLVRRRDDPSFPAPDGVTITAIDDQRAGRTPRIGRLLGRLPSVLIPAADSHVAGAATLWTDVCLARHLRRTAPRALVGSRPGLSVLALRVARPGSAVAAHEHMHFAAHPPRIQRLIAAHYPQLDALVVLTRADEQRYAEALGPEAPPITQIPNATRDLGGPAPTLDERVILAAGRLGNQKGFDLLVSAFAQVNARHPDWHLRICGGGPHLRRLKRQIGALGLGARVSLPGPVSGLGEEMGHASLFVLSSRFEGFPLVLVEAMRKGLPVVSFDCPTGPDEVIENGRDGVLVGCEDIHGLATAMCELIEDEPLRRRLGAAAERKAAAYAMDVVGPRWDAFANALLGAAAAHPPRPAPRPQAATSSSSVGRS
jgi:glycosyltransferase involved in cell wall biosynthesis